MIVHHGDGTFDILGYPKKVFPPTDFHTATLAGKFIYIIGSLGYQGERRSGAAQVYRLNIETFQMEKVETSGENPGWISRHKAARDGNGGIRIRGGKVWSSKWGRESYEDNPGKYILDLNSSVWHKVTYRTPHETAVTEHSLAAQINKTAFSIATHRGRLTRIALVTAGP